MEEVNKTVMKEMLGGNCGSGMKWRGENEVGYKASSAKKGKYVMPRASVFSSCPSLLICLVHLLPLPVFIVRLCSHSPIHFLHLCDLARLDHLFPPSHILTAIYKGSPKFFVHPGMKDGWMICCVCVTFVRRHAVCASVWVRAPLRVERAVSFRRCFWCLLQKKKKKGAGTRSKTHFLCRFPSFLSLSLSLYPPPPLAQMACVGIEYKGSFSQNKSSSCKQHEIVDRCQISLLVWCQKEQKKRKERKNSQADLIPYLHLKDHSAFKLRLRTHGVIYYIIKVGLGGTKMFLQSTFFFLGQGLFFWRSCKFIIGA